MEVVARKRQRLHRGLETRHDAHEGVEQQHDGFSLDSSLHHPHEQQQPTHSLVCPVQLPTRTICIGGLPPDFFTASGTTRLRAMMKAFGEITDVELVESYYSLVTFKTLEQATAAVATLDGRALMRKRLLVRHLMTT